jgi:hypothetical protein
LHERASWDAAKRLDCEILIFETTHDRYQQRTEGFHNRVNNQKVMKDLWKNSTLEISKKINESSVWFKDMRSNVNPFMVRYPKKFISDKKYFVYFSNSDDEVVGFWDEWTEPLGNQFDVVSKLIEIFSNQNQLAAELSRAAQNGPSIFKKINSYRDNGTHADEWLMLLKVLLPLSAFFTLAFGVALHYNLALPYAGHYGAGAFALIFTAFIELSKIIAGKWFFRQLFFCMWKQGQSSAALILAGGLIAAAAFVWSYYNSTTGVTYLAHYLGEKHVTRPVVDMAAKTAGVDNRVNYTVKVLEKGQKTEWQGTTTRDGQRIARNASAALAEQEKQRTILIEQAANEQKTLDTHRTTFIGKVGELLSFLGGKMEWFQVLILAAMVAAEKTLWHRMSGSGTPPHRAPQQNNGHQFASQTTPTGNFRAAMPPPAVNGLPTTPRQPLYHNVPQQNGNPDGVGADAILKNAHAAIQRDLKNLENENGKPRTIADRIHAAMMAVGREAQKPGFKPSPRIGTDFYLFIKNQAYPQLELHKLQMQYHEAFLSDMERFVDDTELELAQQN